MCVCVCVLVCVRVCSCMHDLKALLMVVLRTIALYLGQIFLHSTSNSANCLSRGGPCAHTSQCESSCSRRARPGACWDCLPPLSSTIRTTRHHARVCDPTPRVFECQRRMSITVQHSAVKSMSHNAAVPCTQPNQRPQTNTKHLYINNHNSHLHRGLVHGFELFHVCLGNAPFHKFLG